MKRYVSTICLVLMSFLTFGADSLETVKLKTKRERYEKYFHNGVDQEIVRKELRRLNSEIPPNEDLSKTFQIRTVCVVPYRVDVEWGNKKRYVVETEELVDWPNHVNRQMRNLSKQLFEVSKGKLWLDVRVVQYGELKSLTPNSGGYWLSPSPARNWIGEGLASHEVLYVFFVPKLKDKEGYPGIASHSYYGTRHPRFPHRYITICVGHGRISSEDGINRWDLGVPHELWHFMRDVITSYCSFRSWLPNDDNLSHRKLLFEEIKNQGFDVRYAHEDQYSTFVTWKSVDQLRKQFGFTYEW